MEASCGDSFTTLRERRVSRGQSLLSVLGRKRLSHLIDHPGVFDLPASDHQRKVDRHDFFGMKDVLGVPSDLAVKIGERRIMKDWLTPLC